MKRVQTSNNQNFGEKEPKKVFIQVKMTARCLFGAPDPALNDQLVSKVHNTKKWAFERKWNFSIDTSADSDQDQKNQQQHKQIIPSNSNNDTCYEWEGPFHHHDDYMKKSNLANRNGYEIAPCRIPLLSAPIFPHDAESEQGNDSMNVSESRPTGGSENNSGVITTFGEKAEKPLIRRFRSPNSGSNNFTITTGKIIPSTNIRQVKAASMSSHTTCESPSPDMVSPDDLIFTFPPALKQRSITDYMKVKKIPRVK